MRNESSRVNCNLLKKKKEKPFNHSKTARIYINAFPTRRTERIYYNRYVDVWSTRMLRQYGKNGIGKFGTNGTHSNEKKTTTTK